MASNIDERQLITWFTSVLTSISYTQSVGTTTNNAQLVTSFGNQKTADTSLTTQEVALATAICSGVGSTQPSSSIHSATVG